jgi:hypothetical protein
MAVQDDSSSINPDVLMADVTKSKFPWLLVLSFVAHVILIFGTSIGYIRLMQKHNSWHPRIVMKQLAKERRDQEFKTKREADVEKIRAAQARKPPKDEGSEKKEPAPRSPKPDTRTGGDEKKPAILKELEKTSKDKPEPTIDQVK